MFHRPKFNNKEPLLFGGDVDDGVILQMIITYFFAVYSNTYSDSI